MTGIRTRGAIRTLLAAMAATLACLACCANPAQAVQATGTGSALITGTVRADGKETPLAGDVWSMSQVSEPTRDGTGYQATSEYSPRFDGIDWDTLSDAGRADTARLLDAYATANNLYERDTAAGTDGAVLFDGLEDGLYLFSRTMPADANLDHATGPLLLAITGGERAEAWPKYDTPAAITITAMDMTAYTGGDSMDSDSFPQVRYRIGLDETVRLYVREHGFDAIDFHCDGATFTIDADNLVGDAYYVIIPQAANEFTYKGLDGTLQSGAAADDDATAGLYEIGLEHPITASIDGDPVDVDCETGTLTVRYVSDPDTALSGVHALTIDSIGGDALPDGRSEGFVAVAPEGTVFETNGRGELGIVGDRWDDGRSADIALLSDRFLRSRGGAAYERRVQQEAERHLESTGRDASGRSWQFRYLDLVNANDGNAWVSSSKGMDIYWPYPDGTGEDTEFSLIRFSDLYREYDIDGVEGLAEAMAGSTLSDVTVENTGTGIRFHVDTDGYGPFALSWKNPDAMMADTGVTVSILAAILMTLSAGGLVLSTVRRRNG